MYTGVLVPQTERLKVEKLVLPKPYHQREGEEEGDVGQGVSAGLVLLVCWLTGTRSICVWISSGPALLAALSPVMALAWVMRWAPALPLPPLLASSWSCHPRYGSAPAGSVPPAVGSHAPRCGEWAEGLALDGVAHRSTLRATALHPAARLHLCAPQQDLGQLGSLHIPRELQSPGYSQNRTPGSLPPTQVSQGHIQR